MNPILEMLMNGIKPTGAEYWKEIYTLAKDGEIDTANKLLDYAHLYNTSKMAPAIAIAYAYVDDQLGEF